MMLRARPRLSQFLRGGHGFIRVADNLDADPVPGQTRIVERAMPMCRPARVQKHSSIDSTECWC